MTSIVFLCNCERSETSPRLLYNEKANELIEQIISDNSCNCMLEIPTQSMIIISEMDRPNYNLRKSLLKPLQIQSDAELDKLIELSDGFTLDKKILSRNKVKEVSLAFIKNLKKNFDLKTCSKGIICIQKPIFDKQYKTAVIAYTYAFTCIGASALIYKFENGKWTEYRDSW